jgi:hydroxyacylglutathione hydrolase
MTIYQFEEKGLAHYSYVIMSDYQFLVIDPARNPKQYYEYAMMHEAQLAGVLLTHLHADFVSGHLDIAHVQRVSLYASKHLEAHYKINPLEDGDEIPLGDITLQALYTPGHSYDSISLLVKDEEGKPHTLFSGDTLFIGDIGRPDLRETEDDQASTGRELAKVMYRTIHEKILTLPDEVVVYPAHGAGTLCGKHLSPANCSTIGDEKRSNPALQLKSEAEFVDYLTAGQPFIPKYFRHALHLNRQGPPEYLEAFRGVPRSAPDHEIEPGEIVIDTRPQAAFKNGHLPGALNIMDGPMFETWLGSVVAPEEKFYLIAEEEEQLEKMIARTARIGYEQLIKGAMVHPEEGPAVSSPKLNVADFRNRPDAYTIVDIRHASEAEEGTLFANSLNIPLPELRHRIQDVPRDKPIVVHCAGGYRSAIGSSLLSRKLDSPPVYDLGEAVKEF